MATRPPLASALPVRRVSLALGAVVVTVLLGIGGYYLIGRGRWPLFDCFYMTVVTLTTVGFHEVLPIETTALGRPFTVALLFGGILSMSWFVGSMTAFIVEGDLSGLRWRKRMDSVVKRMQGHVVVCGVGSTGIHCVRELAAVGAPFVVVDRDEETARSVTREHGGAAVVGDATHDEVLVEAGIARARGIISALTEDKDNLYVTVTARALNPQLRIVAKAIELAAEPKLRRAGADSVVSPNVMGGLRMVSEMVRPEVTGFLDQLLRRKDQSLRIEEILVTEGSSIAGRPVGEIDLTGQGLLLLAVKDPAAEGGRYSHSPAPDHVVSPGSVLIVLGEAEKVRRLAAAVVTT